MCKTSIKPFTQRLLSFAMMLIIVLCSLSSLGAAGIFDSNNICQAFISDTYLYSSSEATDENGGGLCGEINQYANDLCSECGISDSITISDNDIKSILLEYVSSEIIDGYTSQNDYKSQIDAVCAVFKDDLLKTKSVINLDMPRAEKELYAGKTTDRLNKHITKAIELKYIDTIKNVSDTGSKICTVLIGLSIAAAVIVLLITFRLRRSACSGIFSDAFTAAGLTEAAVFAAGKIILANNDLYIFPSYLCKMVTRYAHSALNVILILSILLFVVGIIIAFCASYCKKKELKDDLCYEQ